MSGFDPAVAIALVMLVALTIYALLGGADFGAGVWDLLATGPRAERQRSLIAHAIGPVWEANHVWLILVIVLLFTGFPPAFAAVMTAMHVPLSLMLIGIVLRGSAFTFRSYDNTPLGKRRWNRAFSIPSVVTPVLLGTVIGSLATGRLDAAGNRVFDPWYGLFPLVLGAWTLSIFAYLAAVYLTLETAEPDLREDFRRRALIAAVVVGILAYATYLLASQRAPRVFAQLQRRDWGFVLRVATGTSAVAALAALARGWFRAARGAAMVQVALILWGCAIAQAPRLVPPDMTIQGTSAPRLVQTLLLGALGLGALVLVPSLLYLFRIFKGHTMAPWPGGPVGHGNGHDAPRSAGSPVPGRAREGHP